MKRVSFLVAVLLVAGLLAACGGGGGGGGSPEGAAKAFIQALFKGDTAAATKLVCADQQSGISDVTEAIPEGMKVDVGGLTFKTISTEGDTAEVQVGGKIKISGEIEGVKVDGMEVDIGQFTGTETIKMVKEGGQWKICEGF